MWKDTTSGLSLPTLIHPYGYGDIQREDAVIVPGLSHALVFAWRGDNQGKFNILARRFIYLLLPSINIDNISFHLLFVLNFNRSTKQCG